MLKLVYHNLRYDARGMRCYGGMHDLYAVGDIGNGAEMLKLIVEEMYNLAKKERTSAYMRCII